MANELTNRCSAECWNAFEKWAPENGYSLDQSGFNGQHYASAGTQCAWEGWQGAWEAAMHREAKLKSILENVISELDYHYTNWPLIRDEVMTGFKSFRDSCEYPGVSENSR